ncbi:MAG: hypothetical protein LBT97_10990 [Planctomycetota bacterium]|jgi:hypothetical protein|nr:hypothetical protein [Planctomycetota bacterium]
MRSPLIAAGIAVLCAAGVAAEGNPLPNNLLTAQPGEWALVADVENPAEPIRISIVARGVEGGEDFVLLRREHLDAEGKVSETHDRRVKLSRYQERLDRLNQRASRVTREKMDFHDREITVYAVEWQSERTGSELKLWFSADIPVTGFVRMWSSNPEYPTHELTAYGRD